MRAATRDEITPAILRDRLTYCPTTGVIRWRNGPFSGKPAGTIRSGYLRINVHGINILAHRAAWAITHGEWPKNVIDHINHDPLDNSIKNLRDVSALENARNRRKRRHC